MVIVRNIPTQKLRLLLYRRSISSTISTQIRALPTTLYKFFFRIRSRYSLSNNLRAIKRRSIGFVATLRILKILVYKALQRSFSRRNIKVNIPPRPLSSYLLWSIYLARLLAGYICIRKLNLYPLQKLTPTKAIYEQSWNLIRILWLIGICYISYSQNLPNSLLICQLYYL